MRHYNFGAGPATLPEAILKQAQSELLNWQNTGMSVMEISHRSPEFLALLEDTRQSLRDLLAIPEDYHILLVGAPARFHFGTIPMSFLKTKADYIVSGNWSKMAAKEASVFGGVQLAGDNSDSNYLQLPQNYHFQDDADYCYFTPNETLTGLKISECPNRPKQVPLIADMTSCLLSEVIDVREYAMIIAGAQKNIAPSGLSIVIAQQDFLASKKQDPISAFFDYQVHADTESNYATPPTFNIYMANLMFKWLADQGGVSAIEQTNQEKAKLLYDFIDDSDDYDCPVDANGRSMMNVAFRLKDEAGNADFLAGAKKQGLVALKGHRSIGGMRASIYNAMPIEGVQKLLAYMKDYAL